MPQRQATGAPAHVACWSLQSFGIPSWELDHTLMSGVFTCQRTSIITYRPVPSQQPWHTVCLRADWSQHKKYCKHILYVRKKHLSAFVESRNKADPSVSEVYTAALASARAAGNPLDVTYCQMPAKAAEKFVQYCNADILPSGPMEEQIWGLYGDPKSSGYQQLYV